MMTELTNLFMPITSVTEFLGGFESREGISSLLATGTQPPSGLRAILSALFKGWVPTDFVMLALAGALMFAARNRLAILLCWLVPGLGYARIGEKTRGLMIFAGMALLWLTGLLIGGVDSVDSKEDRLWFIAQSGSGPIAYVVSAVNEGALKTGSVGSMLDAPNARRNVNGPRQLNSFKSVGRSNEYGILFTALAGLMNLVSMIDVGFRSRGDERTRRGDDR